MQSPCASGEERFICRLRHGHRWAGWGWWLL